MPKKPKWNEAPCPECKEPVAVDARRCPHCQAVYASGVVDARKQAHVTGQKWGLGCVAILGVFFLVMCVSSNDEADPSSVGANLSSANPAAGSASADVKASMQSFNDDIMAAVDPCDQAAKRLATIAGGLQTGQTSMYDRFRAASQVEESCRRSWSLVRDVEVPTNLPSAAKAKAEDTLDTCENAMIAKQMGGEAMKEVFDGDTRPSKISDAADKANAAQAGVLACVAGIFSTAGAAGVDLAVEK